MRKQKIQMIVLLAVLAVLIAGGFTARKISAREEEEAKKKEEGEYTALSFDSSQLAKLEIASDKGMLMLDCDEGAWSFVKDINVEEQANAADTAGTTSAAEAETVFAAEAETADTGSSEEAGSAAGDSESGADGSSEGTTAYEVNSSEADELRDKIADLTSTNEIENVEDRKEYGLDQPVMTITATLSDGTVHRVEVGSENSMISARYICVDDADTVYTMSESDYNLFYKTDTDLAQEKS